MERGTLSRRSGSMSSLFHTLRRMGSKGNIFSGDSARRHKNKTAIDRRSSFEINSLPPSGSEVKSTRLCNKVPYCYCMLPRIVYSLSYSVA